MPFGRRRGAAVRRQGASLGDAARVSLVGAMWPASDETNKDWGASWRDFVDEVWTGLRGGIGGGATLDGVRFSVLIGVDVFG